MRAAPMGEVGRAYVIINPPDAATDTGLDSDLGEKGHTSLVIARPDGQFSVYLSFAPARHDSRDIARFTEGRNIQATARIFQINGLDTAAMAAYVNELSAHVRARDWGWGYNRVTNNCTQVVERALARGGFVARPFYDVRVGSPRTLADSLEASSRAEAARVAAGGPVLPVAPARVSNPATLVIIDTLQAVRRHQIIPGYTAVGPLTWWDRLTTRPPVAALAVVAARPAPRAIVRAGLDFPPREAPREAAVALAERRGDAFAVDNPLRVSGVGGGAGRIERAPAIDLARDPPAPGGEVPGGAADEPKKGI